MRRLFTLASLFVAVAMLSCTYDDTALQRDLNDLKNKVENLENRVDEQQVLLNALANKLTIVSIATTAEGYIITFSDNTTLTINHGKDGEDGIDGVDGKDGAIIGVEWDDDSAIFTLTDGTTLVIPLEVVEENLPEIPDTPTVGIEAVDLGLSVKWATCNVGAERPEEYGDYFAWGETSPKEEYSLETYQYVKIIITEGEDGWGDTTEYEWTNLGDISGTQYDVASVNWGGAWRMPTQSEQQELLNNCTWEWTTLNDVYGYKVTGPNGNYIFLPAAGYRDESSSYNFGSYGLYSSSSPYEDNDYGAYYLLFNSGYRGWDWSGRRYGQSVRPVSE